MSINTSTSQRLCSQCGSPLIFVREETTNLSGSKFPQTTVIYKCSNAACQLEKDKQTEKRIKMQEQKEILAQKKLQDRITGKEQAVKKQ